MQLAAVEPSLDRAEGLPEDGAATAAEAGYVELLESEYVEKVLRVQALASARRPRRGENLSPQQLSQRGARSSRKQVR
jgi:hypothetical protein